MINDWVEFLRAKGFDKIERREFFRRSLPLSALIYETPLRVGENQVRINTAVEIHDPWVSESQYHAAHLRGDVTPAGIYVCYNESPCWLNPGEKDLVFNVLKQCLVDWIDYWSDLKNLIQYFENPVDTVMTRSAESLRSVEVICGVPAKKRSSPQESYLLSLLYYHARNFKEALAAAESYFEFVAKTDGYEGEPLRTKRQIEELYSNLKLSSS